MLIIGLGNPGKKYEKTYHNVGFLAIDFLAKNPPISNFQFLISKQIPKFQNPKSKNFEYIKTDNLILIKPLLFMNESGKATKEALKHFSVKPEEILVVHDDSDIELGKYKISFGRNSAGHRGVESIIKSIGTKNFRRLRIGIRKVSKAGFARRSPNEALLRARLRRAKAGELVLKKINKKDWGILEKVFQTININNNDKC